MHEIQELVSLFDGKPMTTSRKMAQRFKKRHDNILQLFQTRIIGRHSQEFIALNFQVVEYVDAKGQLRPEVLMTKNGFIAMATKLRGAEAWQERFIAAFDVMTEQLERMALTLWRQRMAIETKDATSFAKGSLGSHLMLDRRKEKKEINLERRQFDAMIQPSLPLH